MNDYAKRKPIYEEIISIISICAWLFLLCTSVLACVYYSHKVDNELTYKEPEEEEKEPSKRLNLNNNTGIEPGYYDLKDLTFLIPSHDLQSYSDLFSVEHLSFQVYSYVVTDSYITYAGNIYESFDRIEFHIYHQANDSIYLKEILIYNSDYSNYRQVFYGNGDTGSVYRDYLPWYIGGVDRVEFPDDNISENYPGAFFDFWTTPLLLDSADNITFDLNNGELFSWWISPYVRNDLSFVVYRDSTSPSFTNGFYLDFTFECGGVIYDRLNLTANPTPYVYYNGSINEYGYYDNVRQTYVITSVMAHRIGAFNQDNLYIYEELALLPVYNYKTYSNYSDPFPVYNTTNGFVFKTDDLRYITFKKSDLNSVRNMNNNSYTKNMTLYELLNVKGRFYTDSATGGGSNIGLGNVFTLLGQAFSSWLPIFNISVIPGVTIGLLLFMPLVVTIIITIIKLVRK